MNAITTLNRVNFYADVTRNGRFSYLEINSAVNDTIIEFIGEKLGDEEHRDPLNFEWIQQIRDSLYNLITTNNPSITTGTTITNRYYSFIPNHVNYPNDYEELIGIRCVIDGYSTYARPTTYNELGPLLEDSFKHPTNNKPYYLEDSTGYTIYRGSSGTISTCTIEYIRTFTDFTLSQESNLINPGGAVLTNGASYIAVEVSVQNAVTRQIGEQFTAVGTSLTSGQVILASLTSPIDLPTKVHEEICRRAAARLLGVTSNLVQSQAIDGLK